MSRRTERPYKVDGTGKLAPHSQARCSVPDVNGPVAQQEFTSLLREICAPSIPATEGAAVRENCREGTQVSRGHSTGSNEPGKTPDGLTTREGLNLADSTIITGRRLALMPKDGASREPAWQRKSAAQSFGTARNRRTRTRMSGGVGAGRSIFPATRFGDVVVMSWSRVSSGR
jgi:hypothetical protein